MARISKVLGQSAPAATTDTTLYTVPDATACVISSIQIANTSGSAAEDVRVAIQPSGEALALKHYLMYDYAIAANDFLSLVIGITLGPGDVVMVRVANGTGSFSAFGVETTLR